MSITVKVVESEEIEYPKMMVTPLGCVVRLSKPGVGTVFGFLDGHSSGNEMGETCKNWGMAGMKPFKGTLTITCD